MTPDPVFIASEGDSADHVWLIAILRTYWRRVPLNALATHCRHARDACDRKAAELGLPPRCR